MRYPDYSLGSTIDLRSLFGGAGPRTPMAHRVEWWPFGTVIRRARVYPYPIKAMYVGGGKAILFTDGASIEVNPDTWVSVPETMP